MLIWFQKSGKNIICAKKIVIGILLHVVNGKYHKPLANIIDDSVITCGEIKETTKAVSTNFSKKK